jgi:hypothetical protein
MNQVQTFGYVDDGQAQIVSLPLAGGQETVVIALPHGDLATYEAGLTATSGIVAPPTAQAQVTLSLPKVTFTSPSFSLATALQAMGMTQAFDKQNADFLGLCAKTPDGDDRDAGDRGGSGGGDGGRRGRLERLAAAPAGHDDGEPALPDLDRRWSDGRRALPRAHRGSDGHRLLSS